MRVTIRDFEELGEFVDACERVGIRFVKSLERGYSGAVTLPNGDIASAIKRDVLLTAFDKANTCILRFHTVAEPTGRYEDAKEIRTRLEVNGLQVVEGEWTRDELEQILEPVE